MMTTCVLAQSLQSCPTLCDPMDYTVYGILQVRIREWVAFPFFRGSSQPGIEPRSPVLHYIYMGIYIPQFNSVQFSCSVKSNSL